METVEAITLDVGGTLIEPWPSVGHVYAEVAARHGVQVEPKDLTRRFVQAWQARDAFQYTRSDWAALVDTTFEGVATQLPSQTFFEELYSHFAKAECWNVYEDVIPTLTTLRQQGIRMAVISNWDDRLRPLLESLELAHWFEAIHVSAEIGAHKPDARIFQTAAEHFGIHTAGILHVGDGEREDHQGALAAGFQSRLLCRREAESVAHIIPSLDHLLR